MTDYQEFAQFSPTTYADLLTRDRVMNITIRPLWEGIPRIAGVAFPVRCAPADNLMLHAAIHRAPKGSIIVVEAGDCDYAVAGGNVCAVAQKNGIVGFVIDGVIRDVAESRANHFPVFARGVSPIPGGKNVIDLFNQPVKCGGVLVAPNDVIVADEEGILAIPADRADEIFQLASARVEKEANETLDTWEANHRAKIDAILKEKGFIR